MKYIDNLEETLKQNSVLRFVCICLALVMGTMAVVLIFSHERVPLIIERGCITKIVEPERDSVTKEEIEAFLKISLEQRFNSDASVLALLSVKQKKLRDDEQAELKSRNFLQFVSIRSAKVKNNEALIESDRLISVGEIRSAFKFPLKVEFSRTQRTQDNPYGLILNEIHAIKSEDKNGSQ